MKIFSIREINTKIKYAVEQLFDDDILIKGEIQPPKNIQMAANTANYLRKRIINNIKLPV